MTPGLYAWRDRMARERRVESTGYALPRAQLRSRVLGRLKTLKPQALSPGLYAWRDRVARERDESTGYVLPRAQLGRLAKRMPATRQELRAALNRCAPASGVCGCAQYGVAWPCGSRCACALAFWSMAFGLYVKVL